MFAEHIPASSRSSPLGGGSRPSHRSKPLVQLARDSDVQNPFDLQDTARDTIAALVSVGAPLYRRDTVVLFPDPSGKPYMQTMTPMIFRTWVSDYLHFFVYAMDKQTALPVKKIKSCSTSEAETILVSHAFWPRLPEIRRTHPLPMPVIRASGTLEMLPIGYDAESQIYTFNS